MNQTRSNRTIRSGYAPLGVPLLPARPQVRALRKDQEAYKDRERRYPSHTGFVGRHRTRAQAGRSYIEDTCSLGPNKTETINNYEQTTGTKTV